MAILSSKEWQVARLIKYPPNHQSEQQTFRVAFLANKIHVAIVASGCRGDSDL